MPTQPKISPQTAGLRMAQGPMNCGACANFEPPNACAIVEGNVSPDMISDAFVSIDGSGDAVTGPDEDIMAMLGGGL